MAKKLPLTELEAASLSSVIYSGFKSLENDPDCDVKKLEAVVSGLKKLGYEEFDNLIDALEESIDRLED